MVVCDSMLTLCTWNYNHKGNPEHFTLPAVLFFSTKGKIKHSWNTVYTKKIMKEKLAKLKTYTLWSMSEK